MLAAILYVIIDIPWLLGNAKAANRMVQNIQGSPLQVRQGGRQYPPCSVLDI